MSRHLARVAMRLFQASLIAVIGRRAVAAWFWRDQRAVSAVEFALLLPLMLVLYIAGNEVGQSIAIYRKVAQVAYTLADLTTQSSALVLSDVSNILAASSAVMMPYSASGAQIVLSAVTFSGGTYKVAWSQAQNATAWTVGSAPPSSVTLPTNLVSNNQQLIVAKVLYTYTTPFTSVMNSTSLTGVNIWGANSITLGDTVYLRPRLSATISCTGC